MNDLIPREILELPGVHPAIKGRPGGEFIDTVKCDCIQDFRLIRNSIGLSGENLKVSTAIRKILYPSF